LTRLAETRPPGNARTAAAALAPLGLATVRLSRTTKRPVDPDWPNPARRSPILPGDDFGVITGPQSHCNRPRHALLATDLDSRAALALAPRHLPATAMRDGRPGKRLSHWFYLLDFDSIPLWAFATADRSAAVARDLYGHVGPFTKSFRDRKTHQEAFKLCGTGAQLVAPPSSWRSADGTRTERREWEGGTPGEPAVVPFLTLWHALCDLAAACGAAIPDVGRPTHRAADAAALPATDAMVKQAIARIATMAGAVSGRGGHTQTLRVARTLAWGYGLDAATTFAILRDHFNARCSPPWTDRELWHKADDACHPLGARPRGYLRGGPVRQRRRHRAEVVTFAAKGGDQ
jgi:hypothetical protein